MKTVVYNQKAEEVGKIDLPESVFGVKWNNDLVHQVVTSMMTNEREPTAHTKDRSQVAGGGKKPWKQKGTGRARHGSIRSPLWVGGGVAHGPNAKKVFVRKTNKKMKAKALFTILSRKFKDGEILFLENFSFEKPKTKDAVGVVSKLAGIKGYEKLLTKKTNSGLIALKKKDLNTEKSLRNISCLAVEEWRNLDPVTVLKYKYLVISEPTEAIDFLAKKLTIKEK